jgi:hypothetical protein
VLIASYKSVRSVTAFPKDLEQVIDCLGVGHSSKERHLMPLSSQAILWTATENFFFNHASGAFLNAKAL